MQNLTSQLLSHIATTNYNKLTTIRQLGCGVLVLGIISRGLHLVHHVHSVDQPAPPRVPVHETGSRLLDHDNGPAGEGQQDNEDAPRIRVHVTGTNKSVEPLPSVYICTKASNQTIADAVKQGTGKS